MSCWLLCINPPELLNPFCVVELFLKIFIFVLGGSSRVASPPTPKETVVEEEKLEPKKATASFAAPDKIDGRNNLLDDGSDSDDSERGRGFSSGSYEEKNHLPEADQKGVHDEISHMTAAQARLNWLKAVRSIRRDESHGAGEHHNRDEETRRRKIKEFLGSAEEKESKDFEKKEGDNDTTRDEKSEVSVSKIMKVYIVYEGLHCSGKQKSVTFLSYDLSF